MLTVEDRSSDSPYVARVWRGHASGVDRMTSVATSHWELVVWEENGVLQGGLRGPETSASVAEVPHDSESFGIVFSHGTFVPKLAMSELVDAHRAFPHVSAGAFLFRGERWQLPDFDDAEALVVRLVRGGVLMRDRLVADVVAGDEPALGTRSVQRRVSAATGLTRNSIRQIERCRQAAILIGEGLPLGDVVHRLGYYDQPHLARSLHRYIGRTATQLRAEVSEPMSLLYKTAT